MSNKDGDEITYTLLDSRRYDQCYWCNRSPVYKLFVDEEKKTIARACKKCYERESKNG